ncbi:hypothetical protein SEA_EASLEY_46 [Gordonia phage Easley]|uniref:Uncharacterized protein n=1 Tax=Gordonia phage Easley TaxID=2182395 RepID=A0A2U8UNM5_9CAUD|nr:hypothetical protein PP510_gp46 [Gordonia phage Easley]AWN05071.1 hypothetical protein SEA_EASLEY_46 [Gordonia phage Easley]
MSHFTVTVALPGHLDLAKVSDALAEALAPFDENIRVPRYVQSTRAELIAHGRKVIAEYATGLYAEYQELGEKGYRAAHPHAPEQHIAYLAGTSEGGGFPAKLAWSDEQVYADAVRWEEPEDIGPDGEVYSTYNPKSQWDWWTVGGRWGGMWQLREPSAELSALTEGSAFGLSENARKDGRTDVARIEQLVPESIEPTFALVDLDGEWHERGSMGWFGMVSDEKDSDDWNANYTRAISEMPKDTWLVNVDCHI